MKLHDIHIDYILTQPFMHDRNDLEALFDSLDFFDPVERLKMIDLTCSIFGINVEIPYWNHVEYCQEIYEEFQSRTKKMSNSVSGFLLTFLIVQTTLISLWDRCDLTTPPKTRKARIAATVKRIQARIKERATNRVVGKAILSQINAETPGTYESCVARYARFCEDVVRHLM